MKIFIDTANVEEIREAASWGILDGVTTNPSLIAKEGRDFTTVVREITEIVDGSISAEVMSDDADGMVKEAEELAKIHKNITIKIPVTEEGLKAVSRLSELNIKTMDGAALVEEISEIFSLYGIPTEIIATSIRTPMNVLQCAKAGADIATIPYAVLKKMFHHPLTDDGIARFKKDWAEVTG